MGQLASDRELDGSVSGTIVTAVSGCSPVLSCAIAAGAMSSASTGRRTFKRNDEEVPR